ncbi:nuclear transport factor 2 family protein [Streptacidiphilus sp. PAMC 29251]
MTQRISEQQVQQWVEGYVAAWTSGDPADIEAIFAKDAESYEWPYQTAWVGRDAIVAGWQERAAWQEGGWAFDWTLLAINGDTFAISGTGVYTELGRFDNLWVVTLGGDGQALSFRMWNNEV